MVKVIKFEVKNFPESRVIGKSIRPDMNKLNKGENPIPAFWEKCFSDGMFATLESLSEFHLDSAYVGWMGEWNDSDQTFTYLCGMLMKPDTPPPVDFCFRDIPETNVAVAWIQGVEPDLFQEAHQLTTKTLIEKGYQMNDNAPWSMELYACPRFTEADPDGSRILDYYIPCIQV